MTGNGRDDLLVGRDDGRVQVYTLGGGGDGGGGRPALAFEASVGESVRAIGAGIVGTAGFTEVVCATYSGNVVSFTTEPLQQRDDDDSYGRSKATVQREGRIKALRKEVDKLRDKVAACKRELGVRERARSGPSQDSAPRRNTFFSARAALYGLGRSSFPRLGCCSAVQLTHTGSGGDKFGASPGRQRDGYELVMQQFKVNARCMLDPNEAAYVTRYPGHRRCV